MARVNTKTIYTVGRDYHDRAANVANSAFYSMSPPADLQPLPNKNTLSFCDPIHKNNITCCALSIG